MHVKCFCCFVILSGLVLALNAQTVTNDPGATHPGHALVLSVIVDGAITPEKISDALAYSHFIMSVATPQNASAEALSRREAFLAPIGLSDQDHDRCISALATVREQLDHIAQARTDATAGVVDAAAQSTLAALQSQENDLLKNTAAFLRTSLTADGLALLDKHVREHIKRRIVIYGQ